MSRVTVCRGPPQLAGRIDGSGCFVGSSWEMLGKFGSFLQMAPDGKAQNFVQVWVRSKKVT